MINSIQFQFDRGKFINVHVEDKKDMNHEHEENILSYVTFLLRNVSWQKKEAYGKIRFNINRISKHHLMLWILVSTTTLNNHKF